MRKISFYLIFFIYPSFFGINNFLYAEDIQHPETVNIVLEECALKNKEHIAYHQKDEVIVSARLGD